MFWSLLKAHKLKNNVLVPPPSSLLLSATRWVDVNCGRKVCIYLTKRIKNIGSKCPLTFRVYPFLLWSCIENFKIALEGQEQCPLSIQKLSLVPRTLVILAPAIHKWLHLPLKEPLLLLVSSIAIMYFWVFEVKIPGRISRIIFIQLWLHMDFKSLEMMKNLRKEEILHQISQGLLKSPRFLLLFSQKIMPTSDGV